AHRTERLAAPRASLRDASGDGDARPGGLVRPRRRRRGSHGVARRRARGDVGQARDGRRDQRCRGRCTRAGRHADGHVPGDRPDRRPGPGSPRPRQGAGRAARPGVRAEMADAAAGSHSPGRAGGARATPRPLRSPGLPAL
ncbi:MAG: hypothetical protein AVDCRST_MAG53-893, partial [uncultured Solirubrobacteraceae bacterium]